ncbi:RIIa domain-containing protein [Plasmodiophora brassicae]|uniref:RIIa domain-containing protein n=1 Tax=Plasmodiophora brassicae TaxID=37360 RepID=A0A0G4IWZ6_PLABS|nr:hypothetical protein PBRA_007602 [Plasmodiophora brassicae]SPR02043.1 unnamed protein product [Plasmodiophora brassicae]
MSDRIYSAEQIVVPPELPHLLKAFTKEVIRHHPPDIVSFSRDYFAALSKGEVDQFLKTLAEAAKSNDA